MEHEEKNHGNTYILYTRSPWRQACSPWKHEISHCESIPSTVVEEPVPTPSVVDKDHYY